MQLTLWYMLVKRDASLHITIIEQLTREKSSFEDHKKTLSLIILTQNLRDTNIFNILLFGFKFILRKFD